MVHCKPKHCTIQRLAEIDQPLRRGQATRPTVPMEHFPFNKSAKFQFPKFHLFPLCAEVENGLCTIVYHSAQKQRPPRSIFFTAWNRKNAKIS